MKRRNAACIIFIFFMLSSGIFSIIVPLSNLHRNHIKSSDNNDDINSFNRENKPKSSNGPLTLNYTDIERNSSVIYRSFESINITIDISGYNDGNKSYIQIYFSNNSQSGWKDMIQIKKSKKFYYEYKPEYDAPLGLQLVNFDIKNESDATVNTQERYTNFTIKSNCQVNFISSRELHRGEWVIAQVLVADFKTHNFIYNITIVDNVDDSNQKNLFNIGNNIQQVEFEINGNFTQTNKYYYIKVNMTDKNDISIIEAAYFQFKVLLPDSILTSIVFNPTSIFRKQSCNLNINVSAQQEGLSLININITFLLKDTNSKILNTWYLNLAADNTFSVNFEVGVTSPAGTYTYVIRTLYNLEEIEQYKGKIIVKNNLPEIKGYEINGYDTDESISVNYGEDLVFEFDVFDVEGVAYISLLLINEDDDEYEITREYEDDLEITVRTAELITGTWEVYVYVTDTDGVTVGLDDDFDTAPQKITIIPDTFSDFLTWIMLIIGLISGILVGTGITHYTMKSQMLKYKPEEMTEVSEKRPKKEKKPKKPELTPTKRKPTRKLIEEEKPEKKELRKPRKIKRKLK